MNKIHPHVPNVSFDYEDRYDFAERTPVEQVADTIEAHTCGYSDSDAMKIAEAIPESLYVDIIELITDAYTTGKELAEFKAGNYENFISIGEEE